MTEIWKDVVGYEGLYQVSNLGHIRSVDREVACSTRWGTIANRQYKGKPIQPHFDGEGRYLLVILRKDGKSINELVHRLVAKAFVPSNDFSLDVNHIDGCKNNNISTNLEWCDRRYNLQHALDIGLMESQCKIRRSVYIVNDNGERIDFPDMASCCSFFNRTKCWLGNYIRKHGNPCRYGKYTICVSERG